MQHFIRDIKESRFSANSLTSNGNKQFVNLDPTNNQILTSMKAIVDLSYCQVKSLPKLPASRRSSLDGTDDLALISVEEKYKRVSAGSGFLSKFKHRKRSLAHTNDDELLLRNGEIDIQDVVVTDVIELNLRNNPGFRLTVVIVHLEYYQNYNVPKYII
ncbi:MAG: hypothetical protein MHPSP_000976 [Paramarteilia canceri]